MSYGVICTCLRVKDLAASTQFYESLGMTVVNEVPGLRVVLKCGHFRLALMTFLDENVLNFRGADVFAVHASMTERLGEVFGSPVRRDPGHPNGAGESWITYDPDGNQVFFDTNERERTDDYRMQRIGEILTATEDELLALGASDACIDAFRRVLTKHP